MVLGSTCESTILRSMDYTYYWKQAFNTIRFFIVKFQVIMTMESIFLYKITKRRLSGTLSSSENLIWKSSDLIIWEYVGILLDVLYQCWKLLSYVCYIGNAIFRMVQGFPERCCRKDFTFFFFKRLYFKGCWCCRTILAKLLTANLLLKT